MRGTTGFKGQTASVYVGHSFVPPVRTLHHKCRSWRALLRDKDAQRRRMMKTARSEKSGSIQSKDVLDFDTHFRFYS
jgi:hypothetical protein